MASKAFARDPRSVVTYHGADEVVLDGRYRASGVYFYALEAGDFKQVYKMVLLK